MFDKGDKLVWEGEEYTVGNIFDQPMITLVDKGNREYSFPLMKVIHGVMTETRREPLGPEFEKVWDDNVDTLYIQDEEGV
jgi:hypothetical protein